VLQQSAYIFNGKLREVSVEVTHSAEFSRSQLLWIRTRSRIDVTQAPSSVYFRIAAMQCKDSGVRHDGE